MELQRHRHMFSARHARPKAAAIDSQLMVIPSSTPGFLGSFTWNVPEEGMTDSAAGDKALVFPRRPHAWRGVACKARIPATSNSISRVSCAGMEESLSS